MYFLISAIMLTWHYFLFFFKFWYVRVARPPIFCLKKMWLFYIFFYSSRNPSGSKGFVFEPKPLMLRACLFIEAGQCREQLHLAEDAGDGAGGAE